jgi:hypothetical protein
MSLDKNPVFLYEGFKFRVDISAYIADGYTFSTEMRNNTHGLQKSALFFIRRPFLPPSWNISIILIFKMLKGNRKIFFITVVLINTGTFCSGHICLKYQGQVSYIRRQIVQM